MEVPHHKTTTILQDLIDYIKHGTNDEFKSVLKNQTKLKISEVVVPLAKAAVESGNKEIMVILLEYGLNLNAALDIVINSGDREFINLILKEGADINEGLYFAVKAKNKNVISLLLAEKANINTNKRNGNTPLHAAILQKCDADLVKFLIKHGADTQAKTKNNKTALDLVHKIHDENNSPDIKKQFEEICILLSRNNKDDNVFECIQGLPDGLSGYSYQIKLFTLYAIRNTKLAMTRSCKYEIATEVKNLIPFDDIYLRRTDEGRTTCEFVQVKQTKKPESNKIDQSMFFTMLKPEKNMKENITGNDSIVKMFIKYDKIMDTLDNFEGVKFIFCTNTHFQNISSPAFTHIDIINDDNLCGVKREKWIVDSDYLYLEIKFVLLNLMNSSKQIESTMDDENKGVLKDQIEILDDLRKKDIQHKNLNDKLWPIKKIASVGLNTIRKCLNYLDTCKKQINKASSTENVINNLPKECEIVHTEDLKVLIKRVITKINELAKTLKSYNNIFIYFSQYDEVEITHKIANFVRHFSVYTNCPTSDELDELITIEISEKFKFDFPRLISAYSLQQFSKWISDFKNQEGRSFTDLDGKKLFCNIWIQLFKEFNKFYIEDLEKSNIKFKEDDKEVSNFLNIENDNKILHVITQNTRLHAIKIMLTLQKIRAQSQKLDCLNIVFTSSEIITKSRDSLKNLLNAFTFNESNDLLILECLDDIEDFQKVFELSDNLRNIIKNMRKQLIIISKSNNKLATAMKWVFKNHIMYEDIIKFQHLTQDSQDAILNKTVNFQNNPILFKTNHKIKDFVTILSACEVIDEEILSEIVTNRESVKFGNNEAFVSHGYNKEFFIPRHLLHVDIRVLTNCNKYLFFITGITREELISKITLEQQFIHDWQAGTLYDNGIVIMSQLDENINEINEAFNFLSGNGKNIFWLEFREELLYRKDRNFNNVKIFEDILIEFKIVPENIVEKIVIVANNSGEGKSTMLTDLAHSMRNKSPNSWIIRVDLRKYADITLPLNLNDIKFNVNDTVKAVELITLMVVKGNSTDTSISLERKLLQGVLNGHGGIEVVLLFDGYDEVSPEFKEKTCILLKALAMSKVSQLWVTTRVHLKEYLEEQLERPAYTLASFTETEQIQFLSQFWKWNLKNYKSTMDHNGTKDEKIVLGIIKGLKLFLNNFKLSNDYYNTKFKDLEKMSIIEIEKFIDEKLNISQFAKVTMKIWKNSIQNDDFLKTPLNLEMLAKNVILREWNLLNFKNVQLFEIYKEFVENKVKIYEQNKTIAQSGNQANRDQADLAAVSYREMHCEIAVRTLFEPSSLLPDLNICTKYQNFLERLTRVGLVKYYGNRVEFVHRSFAEYFFSEYLITHLDNQYVQSQFLVKILLNHDYHLVRTFFDGFLSKHQSLLQPSSNQEEDIYHFRNIFKHSVSEEIIKQNNNDNENVLHVAVRGANLQIFNLIFNNIPKSDFLNIIMKDSREGGSMLHLSIIKEHTSEIQRQVCESILKTIENNIDTLKDLILKCDSNNETALHSATWIGNIKVCDVLMKTVEEHEDILKELIIKRNSDGVTALLIAIVYEKADICDLILQTSIKYPNIFKNLINQRYYYRKETALHIAAWNGEDKICDLILTAAEKYTDILNELITQSDCKKQTALHLAAQRGHLKVCNVILTTVEKYEDILKSLITQIDADEKTALSVAVVGQKSDICELILKKSQKYHDALKTLILKCNYLDGSVLQIATQNGNIEICNSILNAVASYEDILSKVLTIRNDIDQSALHIATLYKDTVICDLILKSAHKYIDIFKTVIKLTDHHEQTALHITALVNDHLVSKFIMDYTVDDCELFKELVTQTDEDFRTALHIAAMRGCSEVCGNILDAAKTYPEVLNILLTKGDKDEKTVLMLAKDRGHRELYEMMDKILTDVKIINILGEK